MPGTVPGEDIDSSVQGRHPLSSQDLHSGGKHEHKAENKVFICNCDQCCPGEGQDGMKSNNRGGVGTTYLGKLLICIKPLKMFIHFSLEMALEMCSNMYSLGKSLQVFFTTAKKP